MWVHNLDPVLLNLGVLQIRWYGLMYVLGFLFTYYWVRKKILSGAISAKLLSLSDLDSLLSWMTFSMIIGARIGEVLLYHPSYYFANPLKIFAIWEGGLAFHGALVGMILVVLWWCHSRKRSFLEIADVFCVPIVLANAFGRVGNFINGELPGTLTSLPWAVQFPSAVGFRHPSQLYEAAYDILIFVILCYIPRYLSRCFPSYFHSSHSSSREIPKGTTFAMFLILYAIFRSLVEFVREPEVMIGFLTLGQLLNIGMIIGGVGILWHARHSNSSFTS